MNLKTKIACFILIIPFYSSHAELNLTLSPEVIQTLFQSVNKVVGEKAEQCKYQEYRADLSQSSAGDKVKEEISLKIVELATNADIDEWGRVLTQVELNSIIKMISDYKLSPSDLENIYYNLSSKLSKKLTMPQIGKVLEAIKLVADLQKDMLDFEAFGARCFYTTGVSYQQVLGNDSAMTGLSKSMNEASHTNNFKKRDDEYIVVGKCRGKEVLLKNESIYN